MTTKREGVNDPVIGADLAHIARMDYTITVGSTPVASAADFQVAMAIQRIIFGSLVTVMLPSGRIREIRECEPDHRFGQTCQICGLEC